MPNLTGQGCEGAKMLQDLPKLKQRCCHTNIDTSCDSPAAANSKPETLQHTVCPAWELISTPANPLNCMDSQAIARSKSAVVTSLSHIEGQIAQNKDPTSKERRARAEYLEDVILQDGVPACTNGQNGRLIHEVHEVSACRASSGPCNSPKIHVPCKPFIPGVHL